MYIYGKNVALSALKNASKIKKATIVKNFNEPDILRELNKNNIDINYVEKRELDKMIDGLHQGIILTVPDYEYCDIDDLIKENSFIIMLDHLEDPHNFGAIIRTCVAANVDGIIIPKDRSVEINSTVMKVSAGALEDIKVAQVINLTTTLKELKEQGFWVIGTDMNGTNYDELDYKGKICLIIGNEGKGMSRLVSDNCDFIATIPITNKINSLNASVAAGIVIFEAIKKRR